MTRSFYARVLGGTAVALALSVPSAQAQDATKMRQLEQMIQSQQRALEDMKTQLEALQNATIQSRANAASAAAKADEALKATQTGPAKMATSGSDKVKLSIYGQVNRGVLFVDDGQETEVFHADNDASSTRVGFKGEAKPLEDLTAGANIEVQFESNSSAEFAQNQEGSSAGGTPNNNFSERKLEVYFKHKRFGNLWIGQGDTASNGIAEIDLSGSDLSGLLSDVGTVGADLLFRLETGTLTGITVDAVMANLDGLSRDDRLRYDTPEFFGFTASASAVQGGRSDYALRWDGKMAGFAAAAGIAYASVAGTSTTQEYILSGSGSILHEVTGLSFTGAAGKIEHKTQGRADANSWYGKLGWTVKPFNFGKTSVGVDYGKYKNHGQNDDDAESWGLGLVQKVDSWGTEFFALYRGFGLDRTGVGDLDDLNLGFAGARIKF